MNCNMEGEALKDCDGGLAVRYAPPTDYSRVDVFSIGFLVVYLFARSRFNRYLFLIFP